MLVDDLDIKGSCDAICNLFYVNYWFRKKISVIELLYLMFISKPMIANSDVDLWRSAILKDCFFSAPQSKKIISKAKQIQQNRRLSNRQTQQKDARQNIINNRRGMQVISNMHVYYSSWHQYAYSLYCSLYIS